MAMKRYVTALGPDDPDDGDEGRRQRGLAIAALAPIRPDRFGYRVPSQSGNGSYLVSLEDGPYCECPDWAKRNGLPCKHVYAVEMLEHRLAHPDGAALEALAVPRASLPWDAYNAAQVYEGERFGPLLRALCATVAEPPRGRGHPGLTRADALYLMGLKVYSNRSARRAMSDVRLAVEAGRMAAEPSFSTAIRWFERPEVTPILRDLIRASALPLRGIEQYFAIDSSGFASTAYNRWFDHKWGAARKEVQWVKLHLMCGVQTCIVTAADATAHQSADSTYLPGFVGQTAEHFSIREVSADAAYSSHQNLHVIEEAGGVPYIPFKKGARAGTDQLWTRMYHLFTANVAEFNRHYHRRSNVETVFHMLKAKFGDTIRAKTPVAQVNEALTKVLCHNICVLIHAMYALDIQPAFPVDAA